ncbi:MAG: extracellular solute-binding protein [Candidatus Fimimorpha sp.]
MPTIIDVARMAGVSQGTASNVLNGKGNVSSEKIKAVEEAAQTLGYTINERAKILRKGSGNIICVILPSIECRQYRELYYSVKNYAEKNGYVTELLLSNDNVQTEMEMIQRAKSMMSAGVITITSLQEKSNAYAYEGFEKVCFVERRPLFKADYFGFYYEQAGKQMAEYVLENGYRNVAVITDSLKFSNEAEFYKGVKDVMDESPHTKFTHISTGINRISHTILNTIVSGGAFDIIITTNIGFAERIRQILDAFNMGSKINIFTLSPIASLPERDYKKYELNYSLIGREVTAKIINSEKKDFTTEEQLFENDGERSWKKIELNHKPAECLNILTLESPEVSIMQGLAKLYTEKTGTEVKVAVFSYDDIYDQFLNAEFSDIYDVFRIDVTWLSWFAERLLVPLTEVDAEIEQVFEEYIPSLPEKYSYVRGKVYALPMTPSVQLLFYRKDLFENTANKRLYRERYKRELRIPKTFEEYNQIAEFFANGAEMERPYYTSLMLGNTGVASTEFLTRIFSHKKNIYGKDGRVVINDAAGKTALNEIITAQKYANKKTSHWWTNSAREFANGDLVMMINFTNFVSEIWGGATSKVAGNIGFGMVPGENPIYGGGTLGISKNSRHKEDAAAFIKWITKEPVASGMAALGSVSPCQKTYTKYDIMNTFPWLEFSRECFEISNTQRTPEDDTRPFDEKKFLNIIGTAVKNVLMGFQGEEDALNNAQKLIDIEINR